MNKKKVILISGRQGSGKTNTIGTLFNKLLEIQTKFKFNYKEDFSTVSPVKIPVKDDFVCVFEPINGFKIGLISAGDSKTDFERDFTNIKDDIDILICAARLINNDESVFKYVTSDIPKNGFELFLNISTFPTNDNAQKNAMEATIADTVFTVLSKNFLNL